MPPGNPPSPPAAGGGRFRGTPSALPRAGGCACSEHRSGSWGPGCPLGGGRAVRGGCEDPPGHWDNPTPLRTPQGPPGTLQAPPLREGHSGGSRTPPGPPLTQHEDDFLQFSLLDGDVELPGVEPQLLPPAEVLGVLGALGGWGTPHWGTGRHWVPGGPCTVGTGRTPYTGTGCQGDPGIGVLGALGGPHTGALGVRGNLQWGYWEHWEMPYGGTKRLGELGTGRPQRGGVLGGLGAQEGLRKGWGGCSEEVWRVSI